jgi:phosphoserine phosphatase RsbU/P
VTEAFNSDQVQFGEARLIDHLADSCQEQAADTVAGLLNAVRRHAGDYPQSDDITVLAMRYAK